MARNASTRPFIPYVRVSRIGGRSGDGFISIPEQDRTNAATAAREGVELWPEAFEDKDRSGGNLERPEFQRALQLIREGKAAGIVVATLDRFSRDEVDALVTLREIEDLGGELICGDGGRITLANGADAFTATMRFAQGAFERRRKGEGFATAVRNAVERGVHLAIPYGYKRSNGSGSPLTPEKREAKVVKLAFKLRAEGKSWQDVATAMNDTGIMPRPWKRHGVTQQARWSHKTVRQMVAKDVYLGIAHSGEHRTHGAHPALVTPEVWRKANRAGKGGRPVGDQGQLLSGTVRCATCGYVMTHSPRPKANARYYVCKQARQGRCDHQATVNADQLEALVMEELRNQVGQASIRASRDTEAVDAARADRDRIQEDLATAVRNFATVDMGSAAGRIAQEAMRDMEAELEAADLAVERAETAAASELGDLEAKLAQWDDLEVAEQRHLIRSVIQCIVVRPSASWREPVEDRATLVPVGPEVPAEAVRLIPWVAGRSW